MIRIKRGNIARNRRNKILKLAKGFFSAHRKLFRTANTKVLKSFIYSYIGRKQKKRYFRRLWIIRINAIVKEHLNLSYSSFINLLKQNKIIINRKLLAYIALIDSNVYLAFRKLIKTMNQ